MAADETNEDWRSNLTNWKSLRKSQSSFQRVQDLDPPEEVPQKPRAKTYKEMMQDRQRRQSSFGQQSVDDLDNDDDDTNYGSSKTRGRSIDDSKQDEILSDRLQRANSNESSFKNEEIVGQVLRYDKEKSDTVEKPTLPTSAHPPPASNNHLTRSNDEVPNNQQKIKIDTNHDFTSPFNPKKSANFSSHRDKFETSTPSNPPASAGKSVGDIRGRASGGGANVSDKLKMWNKPTEPTQAIHGQKNSHDQKRSPGMTGKENVVEKNSSNMFFEKIIRINQRPNHEKGFGFTISGGREHNAPVVVDKVVRGGSADICELKAGDEIIAINGADVARHYSESVQNVLAQSVATGTIELKVKRLKNLDEEFDEEVFSDEESKPVAVERKAHNFSGSQSSLWSSPPSSPSVLQSFTDTSDFLEDLPPPPLPSVPPPPPNWGTFPVAAGVPPPATTSVATPVVSLGFGTAANLEKRSGHDHGNEPRDASDKSREEMLRKKSQFLGLRLDESEELKALKGDQEKKLKPDTKSEVTASISVSDSWNSSIHPPPPHPNSVHNDLLPNNRSSFGNLTENNASSFDGFTMPGSGGGGGSARAEWSNSRRLEIDNRPDIAAAEETRRREQQEQQKLKEREEQLRLMEEKIRVETEQLEREKRRMAHETEQQLSLEREKLRQENERQLQKERERLLREKEEQLRIGEERLHREKEENLRHQHEEQLRREKQRMERDMEEQLRMEREKLTREKDEEIRQERERLQREQGLQKDRLQRENEEKMRQQNEEQLRREKQRLERETEEQLRLERERLTREKDDALRRERERLQREQEVQRKELQEQFELEQRQQRLDQMGQQRLSNNSNTISESLHRGMSVGYGSQSEPSDSDVAEYSMKYGGKTFARLAAHTRSDSSGSVGSKQPPGRGEASFPRVGLPSESGLGQEMQRPISKRSDKADVNENYSSIRSNFENSKAPSKVLEPAPWKPGSQYNHDVNAQFLNDRYPDEKVLSGSVEYPQHPSMTPWHGRTVSLGSQVVTERTATVEPQLRGQTSSIESNFEPQFRGNASLESQFGPPNVGERTTSLGPPNVGERTTSYGQPSGGKTLQEQQEALRARNQYMASVHHDEHNAPPVVGERKASLGPQSREHGARSGPQHFEEQRTLYEDQTLRRQSTTGETGDQTMTTPMANISYLLYGEEQNVRRGTTPEGLRTDDTLPGGYNSYAQQGYNKPSGAPVPPPVDNSRLSTSTVQRDKGFPSYYPAGTAVPDKQFHESSSIQHNASTLPHSKNYDSAPAKNANPVGGPKPFEAPWKYQTSVGDHWLVEEAERMRIAEHTGQKRSWNLGQDHPHDSQKPRDFPEQQHGPDSAGVWAPVDPYANRPSATEMPPMRSTRTVPEPVKQTLLNRINVGGTSSKSPTQLGPLPSYPKDYSQGPPPPPSHSRSISNPVTDSHLYGGTGSSAFPPSSFGSTAAPPSSHASSGGGAVDSLFAYHRQTAAQPSESNLTSLASLSHSQGSLHLDGTPQYSSSSQSYKLQGSYANAPPQSYPSAGTMPNVQAQGGQPYRVYATQEPGYSVGRDTDSFPSYRQLGVSNLFCNNCQRPLTEISGRVLMKDGDLKLQCQNCYQENEVKYSKV